MRLTRTKKKTIDPRVAPPVDCVAPIGSTAERRTGAVADAKRTEVDCIQQLWSAQRSLLDEHGWREIIYAPHDHPIEVITIGSTGIFIAHWFDGTGWFVEDGGDLWPAKPIVWREKR